MSGTEDNGGEPLAKKRRTSSSEDAIATQSEPVAMTTSVEVTQSDQVKPPSAESVPTVPIATAAMETVTIATAAVTSSLATVGPDAQSTLGGATALVSTVTTVGKPVINPVLRPVAVVTNGNIRPSLVSTQSDALQKSQATLVPSTKLGTQVVTCVDSTQSLVRPPMQIGSPTIANLIPLQQTWTTDGKVTLQISQSSPIRPTQTKSPVTLPVALSSGAPRFPVQQVVTLQHRLPNPTSILAKPGTTKTVGMVETAKFPTQTTQKPGHTEVKVTEPALTSPTQISFQMPVKWNTAGTKSLLDNSANKLSVVNINTNEGKSLLHDGKIGMSDTTAPTLVTANVLSTTNAKTFVTGGKLIGSLSTGQIFTQTSSGLVSVPRTGTVVTNPALPQKFVIQNNKYTTQVVTQLVKTDSNKTKITMAEAQIMLPSGPAKISWPVQSQVSSSENKQILITSPIIKPTTLNQAKTLIAQKPSSTANGSPGGKGASMANMAPTAKVVELGSSVKSTVSGAQVTGTSSGTSTKMSVLPAQKNWELIKQAQQLMPKRLDSHNKSMQGSAKTVTYSKPTSESSNVVASSEPIKSKSETEVTSTDTVSTDTKKDSVIDENVTIKKDNEEKTTDETDGKTLDTKEGEDVKNKKEDSNETKTDKDVNNETSDSSTEKTEMKIKVEETTVKQEDFNPVDAMNWKDGVGELPGSNLKFRMNDLGVLEVITDDLECSETLNTSNESDAVENDKDAKSDNTEMEMETEPKKEPLSDEVSNKDEITQCENCGEYGFATDFYKEGRFCSQTCVGAFDSKRMRGVKKHGTMSKMVLGLKKGRKKLLLKDGLNRDKDIKTDPTMLGKKSKAFVWTKYLEKEKATEAPARLFKNPFPSARNQFRMGMRLEGVDPMHQSLFCVLSVAEVCGFRIRLHFDGYSECFDFWADVDSGYIFPAGFCEKNGKILQPPKGFAVEDFSWASYIKMTKCVTAPKSLFSNQPVSSVTPSLFRIGSKLEAVDKKNSSLICVASVADTLGDRVLIHFDSWDDNYDYWCDMTSPFIHPIGYCEENNIVLSPPIDWKDPNGFTWDKYLAKTKSQAVPARAFKPRQQVGFEVGMKVEVVDKRNSLLVRVATIAEVENYMLRIHFDGWSDMYDYWLDDDSPDLHPPGWCAKTGHPLVPPISPSDLVVNSGPGVCPTPGCKGIGHIKGAKYSGHHSTFGCPYSDLNMNKESVVGDRLGQSTLKPDDAVVSGLRGDDFTETKVTSQHKLLSTQSEEMPKKFGRGRRPKSYYLHLEEQKREREQERLEKEESIRQGIHNSVFTSSMISTPKTEVPLCWEQHSKLLPGVTNIRGNDVNKWTIDQVAAFVNTLPGCQEQAKLFKEEQIDGEAFLLLTQSDIVKIMNIKLGPALKIFNSIIMFKNSVEV